MTDAERLEKIEMLNDENQIMLLAFLDQLIDRQERHQNGCDSLE
jgi:hypothetical protein